MRARTYVELTRYLTDKRYFGPLHSLALDQITRKDVAARLNRISLESSSIVALRARAQLSALFSWALAHGLCEANPVIGTLAPKGSQPRERVLADAELAAIWRACGDDDHGRCIRLLILTGCRRQEIGGMCWSEIQFRPRHVDVASGTKQKRPRPYAAAVAGHARHHQGSAEAGGPRPALWHARRRLHPLGARQDGARSAVAVKNWTMHDIRRTVATRMADLGMLPHIIEQILNHQSGHRAGPAGIYNRSVYETRCAPRWRCGTTMSAACRGQRAKGVAHVSTGPLTPSAAAW